jgi:galactose mutarotase-like enzyme
LGRRGREHPEAVLSCWIDSIEVAFTRRVALGDDSLLVTSTVTNRSAAPIPYVWASHPLFAADDSTWVDLHDDAHVFRWPDDGAGRSPLASVWPSRAPRRRWADVPVGTAVKVFRPWPADGVTFSAGGKARSLQFRVSGEEQAPYLGLWVNQRGFPDDEPLTHLAIEPTIGSTDSLSTSMERGTAGALAAGASVHFEVTLVF